MSTKGIEGVFLTTHNWGKAAKFFQSLGYKLDLETNHHSGQLSSAIGPYLFIAEIPESEKTGVQMVLRIDDADNFDLPPNVEVLTSFEETHWGTQGMEVRDPDGRIWRIEAPLKG
jgi:hypothetical protein